MKLYSIWIKQEDDNTFDVNVWDDDNNERDENLEVCEILTYDEAEEQLQLIIDKNLDINFKRLEDAW